MKNSQEEKIAKKVGEMHDELVRLTKDMIRIPTVNPPGENYPEMADLLTKEMEDAGLEVELVKTPHENLKEMGLKPQRVNVIGTLKSPFSGPVLHWNGHYDVVPPGAGWTREPFEPVGEHGKIYGRGSSDMKSGLAAMITAAKALRDAEVQLRGDIVISATPDEETGSTGGMEYLVQKNLIKGDAAIVGEPTGIDVGIAHKGALWMEVTTIGKAAHGSAPHLGINAVEKMAKVIQGLQKLKARLKSRSTNIPMGDWAPTINIGGIMRGGVKINIVPDKCCITIDRRTLPEEKMGDLEDEIISTVKKLEESDPELKVETRTLLRAEATHTPPNEKICLAIRDAVKNVTGEYPATIGLAYFTDMRFLNQVMPTVLCGPGLVFKAHAADEYVNIGDLVTAAKVYSLIALRFLR